MKEDSWRNLNLPDPLKDGLKSFARNNLARTERMRVWAPPKFWKAFTLIPHLLHQDLPSWPGGHDGCDLPHGIEDFEERIDPEFLKSLIPNAQLPPARSKAIGQAAIRSLLLIGSAGSIGQNAASDLDYWVCIKRSRFTDVQWAQFRHKLKRITSWIAAKLDVEVTFYPVDEEDSSANRMPAAGERTEGAVAPLVLKEELYRTMIHVAGRPALWWALPLEAEEQEYRLFAEELIREQSRGGTPLVDLGYPHQPSPQEYLSAALWLSQKSEVDPFKGILKMILILFQVESDFTQPLLCQVMKKAVYRKSTEQRFVDPYLLTINRVLTYAAERFDPVRLNLVRQAVYYKIVGPLETSAKKRHADKVWILDKLTGKWGWNKEKLSHLDNYLKWSEQERLALGQGIKDFLYELYTCIAQKLIQTYPDQVSTEEKYLAGLKSRLLARYTEHEAAVAALPSELNRKSLGNTITLAYNQGMWELFDGKVETWQAGSEDAVRRLVFRAKRAARVAVFMVDNGLCHADMNLVLRARPAPLSKGAMLELIQAVKSNFPPVDHKAEVEREGWRQGAVGPRLAVVNFEESGDKSIQSVDLVCRTSWGEMRHTFLRFESTDKETEKYRKIVSLIMETGPVTSEEFIFFTDSASRDNKIMYNLRTVLAQSIGRIKTRPDQPGQSPKYRLDME